MQKKVIRKVAFLINSLGKGGAERVVVNLAAHFALKEKAEVVLVTSRRAEEEYEMNFPGKRRFLEGELDRKLTEGKGIFSVYKCLGGIGRMLSRVKTLESIWEEEQPDIILAFIGKMNIYALLSGIRGNFPVMVSVRSDPAREYPSRLQKGLADLLFAGAAGVVFQTEDAMWAFPQRVQKVSSVLPNVLDKSFIKVPYDGKRRDEIVMVGRLDANKNHRMVIRAFARIENQFPSWRLVIYGGGLEGSDTREDLEALSESLGVAHRVDFMGRCSNIRERIEKSRVFVLASDYEGMPNALLEAMATGLCVISTDCPCGGPRSVIRDRENGLLIPVGKEEALKEALVTVLSDTEYQEKLGKKAAEIGKELSPGVVCGKWQKEIESRYLTYVSCQS